jgi:hypothetical protein
MLKTRWNVSPVDQQVLEEVLSAALNVHADNPLLHVYSSTQEKLEAISGQLDKEQKKVIN